MSIGEGTATAAGQVALLKLTARLAARREIDAERQREEDERHQRAKAAIGASRARIARAHLAARIQAEAGDGIFEAFEVVLPSDGQLGVLSTAAALLQAPGHATISIKFTFYGDSIVNWYHADSARQWSVTTMTHTPDGPKPGRDWMGVDTFPQAVELAQKTYASAATEPKLPEESPF